MSSKKTLKVTVLEKKYFPDLIATYCHDEPVFPPCDEFECGQVFYTDDIEHRPDGFCAYAWRNIQQELKAAMAGRTLPWVKVPHTYIACCTDGFRPVIFEIVMYETEE